MAEPIVTLKQGKIKGITDTDLNGGTFYKFLGIPYAKPPVGSLRFRAPQPPEPWNGIRDGTKEGSPCLAINFLENKPAGSEDCLYLNIFTKQLSKPGTNPKPVMVFIHGGAFIGGSGSELFQGPKHLLTEDIVLVTINYRPGIFGFLSIDDPSLDVPGNAGLKDQTFALKWVQENIVHFNGDPSNVTIFGVSAGGASVQYQVLSPLAKGLFHKAIAQSGSALNPWTWGQQNAIKIAELLGNKVSTEREALDVLMNASAEELYFAEMKLPDLFNDASKRRPFGPVLEKSNPTAFLTENPIDLLTSGRFNQVTLIQGMVTNEGMLYDAPILTPITLSAECGVFWALGLEKGNEKRAKIAKAIEDFYFKGGMTKDAIYKFIGDIHFMHGIIKSTKLAAKSSRNPVYLYVYSHESDLTSALKKFFNADENIKGVPHGGEQSVLFCGAMIPSELALKEDCNSAITQIVKIWTDFARTGKPHSDWKPVTDEDNLMYFDIDKDVSLKTNPFAERFAFWENILKEIPFDVNNFVKT